MNKPMTMDEKIKTLRENVEIVGIHLEHIERVLLILNPFFPFTAEKIEQLTFDEIDRCDALIYRFTHVQDTLSGKVFTLFLDVSLINIFLSNISISFIICI